VIVLDTHVWIWWVHGDANLPEAYSRVIAEHESSGIGVSIISCWEIAKLVEYGRLILPEIVDKWLDEALAYPGIRLLDLSPRIAIESTRLPPPFHKDPADQIIVATARVYDCALLTLDHKLRSYTHIKLLP
jgi:PIN domain nuclease of toxin-antitoxin system